MKKWEYLVEDCRGNWDDGHRSGRSEHVMSEELDVFGEDGWELVSVAEDGTCVFKRPKVEEEKKSTPRPPDALSRALEAKPGTRCTARESGGAQCENHDCDGNHACPKASSSSRDEGSNATKDR